MDLSPINHGSKKSTALGEAQHFPLKHNTAQKIRGFESASANIRPADLLFLCDTVPSSLWTSLVCHRPSDHATLLFWVADRVCAPSKNNLDRKSTRLNSSHS